ncbi:hypothetical protein VNI00_002646 [Paramarasmius palmivorus]|uniref:Xylosidase/arabinosidase n=1 Tax=Paramarasmius palmivorus TaxID=297713 RepID=A0AAW0DWY7_9AGAR
MARADPSTIKNKFLVGYQGWFACPGDGDPITETGWSHWFNASGQPTTDLWPDVSHYPPCELYPATTLKLKSGEHPQLFSSRNPATVRRHFHWMAKSSVDGAFLRRPLRHCMHQGELLRWRDNIGRHVRSAAEMEHRVYAIMYDVSGVTPDLVQGILQEDWNHLLRDEHVLDSPSYLREQGRAVVCLWGFGFAARNHDPDVVKVIVSYIRKTTPGGAYIIAGVPSHWRTSDGDADPNPEFLDLWLNEVDAILPWTVGCYDDETQVNEYAERLEEDLRLLRVRQKVEKWRNVEYMPVVFPGCSGFNTSGGQWNFNSIKRNGGQFLWRQIYNACNNGVTTLYGATWDEYDEGTALMPAVPKAELLPVSHHRPLMSLDEDGYNIPSDWLSAILSRNSPSLTYYSRYMRICGLAREFLTEGAQFSSTFPLEELLDYWETRSVPSTPNLVTQPLSPSPFIAEEPSPPPYSESPSNSSPLSRYPTSSLLQELQSRQPDMSTSRLSRSSRPLPPIPSTISTEIRPKSDEGRACHSCTSDPSYPDLTDVPSAMSGHRQRPSSPELTVQVTFLADVRQEESNVSSPGTSVDLFDLPNTTFSERCAPIFPEPDITASSLAGQGILDLSSSDNLTPPAQMNQTSEFDSYFDTPLTFCHSHRSEASGSSNSLSLSPSSLFTRRRISAVLNAGPSLAIPDISPSALASLFNARSSNTSAKSPTPTSPSTIFSPVPSESDSTGTSQPSSPGSMSSKKRVASLRCIVRRLKPSRKGGDASVPPVPSLGPKASEDKKSLKSTTSKEESPKKQRREELARELKRREQEVKAQKDQESVKKRPRRRDSTACIFALPDNGFAM